jgi:predicted permease
VENFLFSINAILPLFMIMAIGFVLKRTKVANDAFFYIANKISFKLLLPVMLFLNIYDTRTREDIYDARYVLIAAGGIVIVTALLMIIIPKLVPDKRKIGVIIQGIVRSNFLLFAVPVVRNMFGEEELWTTSSLLPVIVPLFNILAVIVLSVYLNEGMHKGMLKKTILDIIKNPLIIGSLVSYGIIFLKIEISEVLYTCMKDIAGMATPLALISLGGTLKFSSIRENMKYIVMTCFGKLVMMPALILPVAIALGYRGSTIGALLALLGSPIAVSSYVMSEQSGNDGELAAQLIAFSTAASVVTMFLWIFSLRSLGYL